MQVTRVNRVQSREEGVEYGVPQESILGLLLFIVFIDDLPEYLTDSHLHFYAEDTAVSVST